MILIPAVFLFFLFAFDWNHAKPWINKRVSASLGRPFSINGDLSVAWHRPQMAASGWRNWVPWPQVSAHNITVGNPDGVKAPSNMAEISQLSFTLAPLPFLSKQINISTLRLDQPLLLLQRAADGKNNWVFNTGNTGGGHSDWQFELNRLIVNKGSLHVIDAVKKADVTATIDTLPGTADDNYRIGWNLKGNVNRKPVSGSGKAGGVLQLRQQSAPYPLEGEVHVGKTAISVKGTLTKPSDLAALDLHMKVSGVSMGHLYDLTGITLPETPPFATEGRLSGTLNALGGDWTYENFKGKVGSSDIGGTIRYFSREPRPLLKGNVVSTLLQFRDLAPLIGADSNASKIKRGAKILQPADKVLPVEPFKTERWRSIDADVKFSGRRIVREKELPIYNLVTQIRLQDGVLSLSPLSFGMAGGQLSADLTLDSRDKIIKSKMKVAARHLKLKQLFPAFQPMQASLGEINGDASLSATGNSVAVLLGSSNGEIKTMINQGTISKLLLEKMGLNIGNIILAQLFGDRQVKLNCLASDFKVTKGVMDSRAFVMDTEDATLYVNGQINLAQEQLNLTLEPDSKGVRVISLRTPLYVTGTFKQPNVEVNKGVLALKAGSAVVLGVLAPVATALLPLVNLGPGKDSECAHLLAQVSKKPEAPPPGKTAKK